MNLLGVASYAGGAGPEDLRAVRTGLEALGAPVHDGALDLTSHVAQGASAAAPHLVGTAFAAVVVDPRLGRVVLERRASPAGRALVAPVSGGVAFASDLRALWASGFVARRWDPTGVAAFLWRGGACDARLPGAGVRAMRPGERLEASPGAPPSDRPPPLAREPEVPTVPSDVERALALAVAGRATARPPAVLLSGGGGGLAIALAALEAHGRDVDLVTVTGLDPTADDAARDARAASALGLRHHAVVAFAGDPQAALSRCLASVDLPSVHAFFEWCLVEALAREGFRDVVSGLGARTLFGEGPLAVDWARAARLARWLPGAARAKPGGDPLDVLDQRRRELRAFVRVPVNYAHAHAAALPAATRAALSRVGPRPADEIVPSADGPRSVLSDVERRGTLVDLRRRDADAVGEALGVSVRTPFLDPAVVAAVRGLAPALRFGRPGSWGWLGRRLAARGLRPAPPAPEFSGLLDGWVRGPLSGWLSRALAPERLRAQGALDPAAVAEAKARFDAGAGGWTAERLLLPAILTDWIDRHGLSRAPAASEGAGRA